MPEPTLPEVDQNNSQPDPQSTDTGPQPPRTSLLTVFLLLLVGLLSFAFIVVIVGLVFYFQFRPVPQAASAPSTPTSAPSTSFTPPPPPAPVVTTPSEETQRAQRAEAMDAANFRNDELAVVRERIAVALHAANNVQKNIESLRKEVSAWQDAVLPLMTNDQGKAVAADSRSLDEFLALSKEQLPSADLLDTFQDRLDPLLDHLQSAADVQDARHYRPTDEFLARIDTLDTEVRETITPYRRQNRLLQALLLRAPKPESVEDQPTLEEAVDRLENQRKLDDLKSTAEELAALREENRKKVRDAIAEKETKLADAQADAEKKLGELKAEKISAEVEKQLADFEKEQAERQKEAKFQAALPEIRTYLAPFFEESFYQPSTVGPVETAKKLPVSWKALNASGALEPTETGFSILNMTISYAKDREKHGWRSRMPHSHLVKAQELLKEYGEKLVEKKMLSE